MTLSKRFLLRINPYFIMLKQRKLRLISKYFFECEVFDFRYGITTARHIDKEDLGVLSNNLNAGIGYVSSWPSTFKQALHALGSIIRDIPELTFIDFGSGMGKVCFLADFEIRNHYQGDQIVADTQELK